MSDLAIKTVGLTKTYGRNKANDNISLQVERGSIYGLVGRNGAGKTTFMRALLGLFKPNSGSIELLGKCGKDLNAVRAKIGFLVETPAFYERMSAFDNLLIRAKLIGLENPEKKIYEVMKKLNLAGKEKDKVKSFSLGMKQNLGIANAILGNPELLILDEPVNGLDPIAIVEVREILLDLVEKGSTILISSHILSEIQKMCTCYGFILDGKLVKEVSEKEIEKDNIDLEKLFVETAKGTIPEKEINNDENPAKRKNFADTKEHIEKHVNDNKETVSVKPTVKTQKGSDSNEKSA